jgi:RNA polymerase sigma-70 factor, ECF subfamily
MPPSDTDKLLKHFVEEDMVLRAYLLAATRNEHDAQDLLQTVWKILWEKYAQYDERRPFRAWAFGVARLEVLKWRQSKGRSREFLSEDTLQLIAQSAEEQSEEIDLRGEFLRDCVKSLKGPWYRVLRMKYYQEKSIREIAEAIGSTCAAVEMVLVRARRALRACIEGKLQQETQRP